MKDKFDIYIDGSSQTVSPVFFKSGNFRYSSEAATDLQSSRTILKSIDSIMAAKRITFGDLNSVIVQTGPGSFTGLRVGITIAKIISLLLAIPINGKNAGDDIPVAYRSSRFDR
jgi:tRNA threonylcarbamoyladenosine biosynthesis protein TsaB